MREAVQALAARQFPKLLYLGDVPVEASYHGSALLYRLLQNYAEDKLLVVEAGVSCSLPDRRLPGVRHVFSRIPGSRLEFTRFSRLYALLASSISPLRASAFLDCARKFSPEAILTVVHGYSWITAARVASMLSVPLHLVCHDDWPRIALMPMLGRRLVDRTLRHAYRQAASRLCVSPSMQEDYLRRYGAAGTLLYPSHSPDARIPARPTPRLRDPSAPLAFAYAGSLSIAGYIQGLQALANSLESEGGALLLYGPFSDGDVERNGLKRDHTRVCGLVKQGELLERLRNEADVLFVPMSFDPADRDYMRLSFPSKLADYTAVGLPLLIYGPPYCSAVCWAKENPGVAEVVVSEDPSALALAVRRLSSDSNLRQRLSRCAVEVGNRCFSAEAAAATFYEALSCQAQ